MHYTTSDKFVTWKLRKQKDRKVKLGIRERHLKKYGITSEEYNELFILQEGKCAICSKHQSEFKTRLAVDHCHETFKIRGLLCFKCNTGLGSFKHDVANLKAAITYLDRP